MVSSVGQLEAFFIRFFQPNPKGEIVVPCGTSMLDLLSNECQKVVSSKYEASGVSWESFGLKLFKRRKSQKISKY